MVGCFLISANSSGVSLPGFFRIASGTPILPTSCSNPAHSSVCTSRAGTPRSRPVSRARRRLVARHPRSPGLLGEVDAFGGEDLQDAVQQDIHNLVRIGDAGDLPREIKDQIELLVPAQHFVDQTLVFFQQAAYVPDQA